MIHEANKELDLAYDLFTKVLEKNINFKSLVSILRIGSTTEKYSDLLKFVEMLLKKNSYSPRFSSRYDSCYNCQ